MEKYDGLMNYIFFNMDDFIVLNVGGKCFEIYEEMFVRFFDILFGFKSWRFKFYNSRWQEYFFDRYCLVFDVIFYYY